LPFGLPFLLVEGFFIPEPSVLEFDFGLVLGGRFLASLGVGFLPACFLEVLRSELLELPLGAVLLGFKR
jgi:hypothetical protein